MTGFSKWREEHKEKELGHRHLSHLLGVFPIGTITPKKADLFTAAKQTLAWRKKTDTVEWDGSMHMPY